MPKPRSEEVVIHTGDHLGRIRHLERQHAAAQEAHAASLTAEGGQVRRVGETPESTRLGETVSDLAAEHDKAVTEAEAAATRVWVTTVRRKQYRELADAHPPREGNKGDEALGINAMSFREALVPAAITEVTEEGKTRAWSDYSDDEREDFLDVLAESDMERLFATAYGLVNGFTADPKLLASHSSQATPKSDEN